MDSVLVTGPVENLSLNRSTRGFRQIGGSLESSVAGPIERDIDGNRNLGIRHLNQGESNRRALSQGFRNGIF